MPEEAPGDTHWAPGNGLRVTDLNPLRHEVILTHLATVVPSQFSAGVLLQFVLS